MSRIPRFLDPHGEPLDLRDPQGGLARYHVFDDDDVHAVNAALAARRPLLLRGRPGTGKSQLARAAAVALGRAYVAEVVDARTESRDLLWRFDAIRRLADAQVAKSRRLDARQEKLDAAGSKADVLDERFYTTPGVLWWAFRWSRAEEQVAWTGGWHPEPPADCDPEESGVVVLLDEIDKADSSVPNGLLGVLGDRSFHVPGYGTVAQGAVPPLVVITTNEERSLPDAFLRRCAVHHLDRDHNDTALELWLKRLGDAHFGDHAPERQRLSVALRETAAGMVMADRRTCLELDLNPPGGAEYLDLLRAVLERSRIDGTPEEHLKTAARFLVKKQPA